MTGTTTSGLLHPPIPGVRVKVAEVAVTAAQHRINDTRVNLTASWDAYMEVSEDRQRQQSETTVKMTRVGLEKVTLKGMLSTLEWR
jgi:hypothetical protein